MTAMKKYVDLLFQQQGHFQSGDHRENPVTGDCWVHGDDSISEQKQRAIRALALQGWFSVTGPEDAPPLPLGGRECSEMMRGGLLHLVALYAHSIIARGYKTADLPSFDEFACGVMARCPDGHLLKDDPALAVRFPARPLRRINSALVWE